LKLRRHQRQRQPLLAAFRARNRLARFPRRKRPQRDIDEFGRLDARILRMAGWGTVRP